ncbi:RHS repeat-associated core domain-containing protein [Dyadobacter tibetensis]|uniref:RHS repeat-associated core domain-containing protein n=1 Tax=Dyadobacter tibetensis TaxID=1211851 RepID=UPI0018DBE185|nr:RHS repeat-associated core domain-containing protein [Dyadobacter tibetensis]
MIIWAIPGRGGAPLVFTDKNGSGSIDHTEILGETHYYPFGKAFDGAWYNDATASKYKYLYNGKELSEEIDLNFYDYGARWLDPGLGSWWEVDPASEVNRRWSPYVYGNNNPVRFIDPDGMSAFELTGSNGYGVTGAGTGSATEMGSLNQRTIQDLNGNNVVIDDSDIAGSISIDTNKKDGDTQKENSDKKKEWRTNQ